MTQTQTLLARSNTKSSGDLKFDEVVFLAFQDANLNPCPSFMVVYRHFFVLVRV